MWILRIALFGSVALGIGCSKDGGVIIDPNGGTGGGTSSGTGGTVTTSTAGSGGASETTTTLSGGAGGSSTTTTTGGAGGETTTTGGTGGAGGQTTTTTVLDQDQDGWTIADGDCCDSLVAFCSDRPELVNPGALEVPGNQVDDDCNPATPDNQPFPTCSTASQATMDLANGAIVSAPKLAKAMDLCQFTGESPPLPQKTWGIISANYFLADGSPAGMPKNVQVGVLPDFGPNVKPQYGETMVALSSGAARREGDSGFVHPKNGGPGQTGSFDAQTACSAPPAYLAAHGGAIPSQCGECVGADCTTAYDSVSLRLRIRPPTNAKGFSYRFDFYSSEYPQYVCQDYNDFFLTLISGNVSPSVPLDGNVAFDVANQPISVNNSLFDVCLPTPGYPCQGGTIALVGNGWGGWGGAVNDGGATGWLQNDVPLTLKPNPNAGGEPIPTADPLDLELVLWDGGDHHVDSLVLLDRFRWSLQAVTLGTHHE